MRGIPNRFSVLDPFENRDCAGGLRPYAMIDTVEEMKRGIQLLTSEAPTGATKLFAKIKISNSILTTATQSGRARV